MTELIEVKTSALEGEALNWAVAKARKVPVIVERGGRYGEPDSLWFVSFCGHRFNPVGDGRFSRELQEQLLLCVNFEGFGDTWVVTSAHGDYKPFQTAPRGNVNAAICRAAVEALVGSLVMVPTKLVAP